ncbi:type III restriction-modification system endonuclease, partial [Candidatus Saccharibacteria bacterium]|nr:type III restriction-modification system endonuclease [Candidatus Saccharibacteria bacterium]
NYVYANPVLKRIRGIDVKMETGTGKTYVYTRLMHELYQQFGINKFIIMTPSLPIKEGSKSFITSNYAIQHFRELFPMQKINLQVVNAGDFSTKKGKRKQFAGGLTDYCEASRNDVGTVNALLLNDAMLASKSMTRDDYDQTLIGGSSCPVEAIKLTRPIVIIDEPHRFKKDGTAWENILKLNPQLIIRFGATFPNIAIGSGRSKTYKKDYDNLVYDLNAVESFNQGLVKSIDVNYPSLPENQASVQYRVDSVTNKELILKRDNKKYLLSIGEDLSVVDSLFDGDTTYEGKKLSNELELAPGMILTPGVWSNSYQELIVQQAIDAHFVKERELFYRPANAPRVKVLSLYFIDSISSYRAHDGWLKRTFEKLLNDKLTSLISTEDGEYKEFLEATKTSLNSEKQEVHAGYFSEDTGKKGDEAIQAEVDDILRNKRKLLQFKDMHGKWNTRRFLFSKWTLREGWDNPNIFVLTKLRSSGSEISKIQEVGRGLRLPVDELGNRLSSEEFRLHFLIDYSEKDFAQKLVGEINADGGKLEQGKITDSILDQLIENGYALDRNSAFFKLGGDGIVDHDRNVLRLDLLEKLVPVGIKHGKIRVNALAKPVVRLRKNNWSIISNLWAETSKRYMLKYNVLSDDEIGGLVSGSIDKEVFSDGLGIVKRFRTDYDDETKSIVLTEETVTLSQSYGKMHYGEFLHRLHEATNLPSNTIHSAVSRVLAETPNPSAKFNDHTVQNIKNKFTVKFIEMFAQKYTYDPLSFTANVSVFNSDNQLVNELDQGVVGTSLATDIKIPDNYLYDEAVYDSEIEHEILRQVVPDSVVVFGKLPRRSIQVPTFTGGTSSPDFVYAIREKNTNNIKIYALIEAKGKEESALSDIEKVALSAQAKMSSELKNVNIELVTEPHQVMEILGKLS